MSFPSVIKLRIFGSNTCKDCVKQKKAMDIYSIDFEFIDADDEKNDFICDQNEVDDLPCMQAYRAETGEVILTRIGYISPLVFMRDLSAKLEEINSPINLNLKGVKPASPFSIQPTKKIENGCNGCTNDSKNNRP